MAAYTTSLKLIQPASGEFPGAWGTQVNNGLTALVDAAVAGTSNITMVASDYVLTSNPGTADEARAMFLVLGGSPGASRNVICPAVSKLYFVTNNTGFAQTVKTATGSGVSVQNNTSILLRCDGTNVVSAINGLSSANISFTPPGAGAVVRTAQDKLRDVYSITDFGAVGDNATDNTAVFNTIEALSATFFYMPAGTYRTTQLQLTKTYWGPGVIRFNDGFIQKGVDFTEQPPRNVDGNLTVGAPGDLVLNPNGNVTFAGKRIQNVGIPLGDLDGVNLSYINTYIAPRIAALEAAINSESGISYTTGTFTPTLFGSTIAGVGTYTLQLGSWVKIGKLLTVRARVVFTDHTGTGPMNMNFGTFGVPSGPAQIGQVLTTFPYGVDNTPNYSNFLFSAINTTGIISFYRKQSDGLYTTFFNLVSPHSGTAQGGAINSITLAASANANNNYYCDRTVRITGGPGAGQERQILFYNGTSKVATISTNWGTPPDNTSTYTVTCSGSVETIISAEV